MCTAWGGTRHFWGHNDTSGNQHRQIHRQLQRRHSGLGLCRILSESRLCSCVFAQRIILETFRPTLHLRWKFQSFIISWFIRRNAWRRYQGEEGSQSKNSKSSGVSREGRQSWKPTSYGPFHQFVRLSVVLTSCFNPIGLGLWPEVSALLSGSCVRLLRALLQFARDQVKNIMYVQ